MNELSERAKKIAAEMRDYACFTQEIADSLNGKLGWISEAIGRDPSKHQTYESFIEQALLAERRLAMEEAQKLVDARRDPDCICEACDECMMISAELFKLATPRGGETHD